MSALEAHAARGAAAIPLRRRRPGSAPRRPRLLSHVGRWGRAAGGCRPTRCGCSTSAARSATARRRSSRAGPEGASSSGSSATPSCSEQARRRFPWLPMIDADAAELPLPGQLRRRGAAARRDRARRRARARARGGRPRAAPGRGDHRHASPTAGPTQGIDALNVYAGAAPRRPTWPALEEGVLATEDDEHRHFTAAELSALLGPEFTVERGGAHGRRPAGAGAPRRCSMLRVPLRAPRAARLLMPLHLIAYILDDLVPTGPCAYHLAVRARRNRPDGGAPKRGRADGPASAGRRERKESAVSRADAARRSRRCSALAAAAALTPATPAHGARTASPASSPRTASANATTPTRGRWGGSRASSTSAPAATCCASKTRRSSTSCRCSTTYLTNPSPAVRCPPDPYHMNLRAEIWQYTPATGQLEDGLPLPHRAATR